MKTLSVRLMGWYIAQKHSKDVRLPPPERTSFWLPHPLLCYRGDCRHLGYCQKDGAACGKTPAGPLMLPLHPVSRDWRGTWRDWERELCRNIGHWPGIEAYQEVVRGTRGTFQWKRGRRAVQVADLFLESLDRPPACCHSHAWRMRFIEYIESQIGRYHFRKWYDAHLATFPSERPESD